MQRPDASRAIARGLHRLGTTAALDGRIAWAPPDLRGHQPLNCYLLQEEGAATLIDTGPAAAEAEVTAQLRAVLRPGVPLTVFLTRAEYEGAGNVGAVHAAVGIAQLIAGGLPNIFDGYAEVAGFTKRWEERTFVDRVRPGETLPVGASRRLQILSAPLRILATFWAYDQGTRTLFTSDAFGHTALASPGDPVVIDSPRDDRSTYESVRAHVLAKFGWVAHGRTRVVSENLRRVFEEREVEIVAPMHGCVLVGRPVVERHLALLQRVLGDSTAEG